MAQTYSRVIFAKPPLKLVIGQIRFSILMRFSDQAFLDAFRKALEADYPRVKREEQQAIKFSTRDVETKGETLWRFTDRDESWSVVLGEVALTLECYKYHTAREFLSRFQKVLEAGKEYLEITDRTRLGFRYVNEFRGKDLNKLKEWQKQLNPEFIGFAGSSELIMGDVEHSFQEIHAKRSDGTLVIRHGLLSGTTLTKKIKSPSNGEADAFYLLDLDYFDTSECPLDINSTVDQMKTYNECMYQFFRWVIDGGHIYKHLEPM